MYERILVPVDLTEKSLPAVEAAFEFAKRFNAGVTLLHVIEKIEYVTFDEVKDFYKRLDKSAREGLQEFAERFKSEGLEIEQAVAYGKRSREVVNFAIESRADLIIMASHRVDPDRPGHDWSSISYAVAILAPCPVLLVK